MIRKHPDRPRKTVTTRPSTITPKAADRSDRGLRSSHRQPTRRFLTPCTDWRGLIRTAKSSTRPSLSANRITELDPDDVLAHTSLSILYQRKGMVPEAEAEAARRDAGLEAATEAGQDAAAMTASAASVASGCRRPRRQFAPSIVSYHAHGGRNTGGRPETPFEVIVGAILTQNTSWTNVERALANLRAANALSVAGNSGFDTRRAGANGAAFWLFSTEGGAPEGFLSLSSTKTMAGRWIDARASHRSTPRRAAGAEGHWSRDCGLHPAVCRPAPDFCRGCLHAKSPGTPRGDWRQGYVR